MHERRHAQRKHIIHSLDVLLYQLHTLSFFMSPSIWAYICRLISQFQTSKPRELDPTRSLRFFFILVVLFNFSSLWSHATKGATEGKAAVLDFVGLAYTPSKLQLLFLDCVIIFLQMLLSSIAYETSLSNETGYDTSDRLLPTPPSPVSSTSSFTFSIGDNAKTFSLHQESTCVLDLRLTSILDRLRNPPPIPNVSIQDPLLPLPSASSWPLPPSLRALLRARAELRHFAENQTQTADGRSLPRFPGTMESGDGRPN